MLVERFQTCKWRGEGKATQHNPKTASWSMHGSFDWLSDLGLGVGWGWSRQKQIHTLTMLLNEYTRNSFNAEIYAHGKGRQKGAGLKVHHIPGRRWFFSNLGHQASEL